MSASIAMDVGRATNTRRAACEAMERELEENWDRIHQAIGPLDDGVIDLVSRAYWFGVTTGVAVFSKAIDGDYT